MALAATHEGEARPEAIHQKVTHVQTIKDELAARSSELSSQLGNNIDPIIMRKFHDLIDRTKDRIDELQEAKLQAQELDGLIQDFNDWAEMALERTLAATGGKLTSTFETIQVEYL